MPIVNIIVKSNSYENIEDNVFELNFIQTKETLVVNREELMAIDTVYEKLCIEEEKIICTTNKVPTEFSLKLTTYEIKQLKDSFDFTKTIITKPIDKMLLQIREIMPKFRNNPNNWS